MRKDDKTRFAIPADSHALPLQDADAIDGAPSPAPPIADAGFTRRHLHRRKPEFDLAAYLTHMLIDRHAAACDDIGSDKYFEFPEKSWQNRTHVTL